jgi:hypothetical protein
MAISLTSPNVDNYYSGKGIVSFKPESGADFIDLGNVPEITFEFEVERLDHFSSRTGVRNRDKSVVIQKTGIATLLLDEWTAHNVGLAFLGAAVVNAGEASINIGELSETRGTLKFVGMNDIGPKWTFEWPNCSLAPSAEIGLISEEWGQLELQAQVEANPTTGIFGTATATFPPGGPTFDSIAPNTGPAAGGTATVITGTNLTGATGVTFDGVAGTSFSVVNATTINVTSPAGAAGAADIVIQHPSGNVTAAGAFTYS